MSYVKEVTWANFFLYMCDRSQKNHRQCQGDLKPFPIVTTSKSRISINLNNEIESGYPRMLQES